MHLVVSGHEAFLNRHAPIIQALDGDADTVTTLPCGNLGAWLPLRAFNRLTRGTRWHDRLLAPDPNPFAFKIRSRDAARRISRLSPPADVVLHVFGTFCPGSRGSPPYAVLLDYTMAQAERDWPAWAEFRTDRARRQWRQLEGEAYRNAGHVFAMSAAVQRTLVHDYGVAPARVSVVDSAGAFVSNEVGQPLEQSPRLVIDGSDPVRKGVDVALDALALVRRDVPDATLTVLGRTLESPPDGVVNEGQVSMTTVRRILRQAAAAVAPARCDPFPVFLIEALGSGLPCIVSSRNGLSDLIREYRCGIVVDSLDPAAYAAALTTVLTSSTERLRMSSASRRLVEERLNARQVARRLAPVLRALART